MYTFLFLAHFDVICALLLNRRTAKWNLFVTYKLLSAYSLLRLVSVTNTLSGRNEILFEDKSLQKMKISSFRKYISKYHYKLKDIWSESLKSYFKSN